jgi:FRG domain
MSDKALATSPVARSVSEFVDIICKLRDAWIGEGKYFDPWFRGQRKASWRLVPNIFRFHGLLNDEDQIRSEFQRRAQQFMTEKPPDDWDGWSWYFVMQHYGAPTRLLDWTDSAMVALFFSLYTEFPSPFDSEEPEVDAAVWMLDPWWLNIQVLNDDTILLPSSKGATPYLSAIFSHIDSERNSIIDPESPVSIDPPFIARRVAMQRSHFTVFGKDPDGLSKLAAVQSSRLIQIRLPRASLARMRSDLLTLGVSDTSIYPDLRGLSAELIRFYRRD